uniref:Uncharacterized protein n=1 Tax=Anguilla anguilla TaxID=7936 RepID=A0A0E9RLP1_ANGAN
MNHSSILQTHLNGEENSLSGGEHSIRICLLPLLPLCQRAPLIKKRIKARQQVRSSVKRQESCK